MLSAVSAVHIFFTELTGLLSRAFWSEQLPPFQIYLHSFEFLEYRKFKHYLANLEKKKIVMHPKRQTQISEHTAVMVIVILDKAMKHCVLPIMIPFFKSD